MEKLVRDKIPEIIEQKWEEVLYRLASSVAEKIRFLIEKATEEESEFQHAIKRADKIWEAADCAEVYNELIAVSQKMIDNNYASIYSVRMVSLFVELKKWGITLDELVSVQKEKREQRGGFKKGIILIMEESRK
jgi:predicted house-cleaning noncanonical NTP pyrophosphatase (MazG superfamily)